MKHAILTFTVCLSILTSLFLNGCTQEVIYDRSSLPDGVLVIDSYAVGFEKVVSKASPKNPFEYSMTSKCLLVFDKSGAIISKEYKGNGDASFLVDRKVPPFSDHDQTLMDACKLYIVANLQKSDFDNIKTETDLLNMKINAQSSIHLDKLSNFAGLPMIGGVENVNLQQSTTVVDPIAPIQLKTIYAKVVVDIQLNIEQNVPGNVPMFQLKKWTVHNAPGYTKLGAPPTPDEETPVVKAGGTEFVTHTGENKLSQGTNPITNGGKHMVFDFYVLEHRVNVKKTFDYPTDIREEQKQRFKPNLMNKDQKPLYIEIKGVYTDHQGHDKKITYNLYLGENNWNNFHINRNCLIQNNVTIKGITNEQDDPNADKGTDNVSVDNRVNIDHSQEDFIIKVERETMLDSHIEIRPLDIELTKEGLGNKVVVEIVDPNNKDAALKDATRANLKWMRFEKKNSNPDQNTNYCDNGKRKYFTENLLTELNTGSAEDPLYGIHTIITSNSDNRIWVYFDENPNATADGMREATLKFTYYENASPKKEVYYKFRQHDLYPVIFTDETNTTRTYYLEFYEEYLYNFDPKDPYTSTKEGMPWGVTGVDYSSEIKAIPEVGGILDADLGFIGKIKDSIVAKAGYYDYENLYKGAEYTKKLIDKGDKRVVKGEKVGGDFTILQLDQPPRSAAEYCYNKNKRDNNGNVVNMDWYLPAIGEIQEITTGAYSKFAVFQEQYYWSSQTSYIPGKWEHLGIPIFDYRKRYEGTFKFEDKEYARATRTVMVNGKPTYESSDADPATMFLHSEWKRGKIVTNMEALNIPLNRHPGNHLRSDILRVRAIRTTLPK